MTPAERDVVYICRAGETNEELRHSLRSLANLPHRRVWFVGYRPRWVADDTGYVPTIQRGPKHSNTWSNWVAAARTADISDEFVLFNDDFYVVRQLDEVPTFHRGDLDEMIRWYGANRLTSHRQRAAVTRHALARAGRAGPFHSYELHVPMVVNRHALAEAVGALGSQGRVISKRTFYGNFTAAGGERMRDVKVMRAADGLPEPHGPFLSTSPNSWQGLAGGHIRQLFAEQCRYERVSSGHLYQPPGRGGRRGAR